MMDGCKISAQCRRVLDLVAGTGNQEREPQAIQIPFFGTIVQQRRPGAGQTSRAHRDKTTPLQQEPPLENVPEGEIPTALHYTVGEWIFEDLMGVSVVAGGDGSQPDRTVLGHPSFSDDLLGCDLEQDWFPYGNSFTSASAEFDTPAGPFFI
jgi:hypothetical protein